MGSTLVGVFFFLARDAIYWEHFAGFFRITPEIVSHQSLGIDRVLTPTARRNNLVCINTHTHTHTQTQTHSRLVRFGQDMSNHARLVLVRLA